MNDEAKTAGQAMEGEQGRYPIALTTERLILRELEDSDFALLRTLDADREVVRYQSNDVLDEAGTWAYLRRSMAEACVTPRHMFDLAVLCRDRGELLGRAGLAIRRPEHREAECWFVLRRDFWGQGYATEALKAVLDLGFGRLSLHRIYGDCDPRNVRSARVMEKVGLRREAHLRENWWLKGEWCDSFIFARLESDGRTAGE